ncbi:DUF4126 domain-containing protein [Flavihumibacter sp. CACIAM 22H1]|uniref:DUF4126 domain-containing protein n=1 Tax=Flavihumibacter sp. CACIAM 22H1 TaxID=1812911 RepID=UPI0007A841BB|nr:DUF4126 domain-containing protein [Flavihumibacter sp. CACIAM 22H1]KYP16092.1 MAG: hypothetical protein A1D16_18680 [Flavihumibacter sp. CACIAM 22H1]
MEAFTGIMAVSLGIALSACCGFRVFLPLLIASIAIKAGWLPVPQAETWMGSWAAILSFGTASVLEIAAYYIPFIDNVLDTIATPLAIGAGSLLAAGFLPVADWDPMLRWGLGILTGGAVAGTIQAGTSVLRLVSTKTTAGTGNALVATGEHLAAGLGSIMAVFLPILVAVLSLCLVVYLLYRLIVRTRR